MACSPKRHPKTAVFFTALLAANVFCLLAYAQSDKAQPKEGRPFTPPLSERIPDAVSALPHFGSIEWTVTHLPWVAEGPYEGISGAGMVEIGGKIYVAGGFIPGGDDSGDKASYKTSRWTWRYDPATGSASALIARCLLP